MGDYKRHFLILHELKTLGHVHLWVTMHPSLPEIVPFMPAFLAFILIDLLSLKNIFIWPVSYMVIFNIYQNAKGISLLLVFNDL